MLRRVCLGLLIGAPLLPDSYNAIQAKYWDRFIVTLRSMD
jgi:hypothetical protein